MELMNWDASALEHLQLRIQVPTSLRLAVVV
jgi:hypothetical protein